MPRPFSPEERVAHVHAMMGLLRTVLAIERCLAEEQVWVTERHQMQNAIALLSARIRAMSEGPPIDGSGTRSVKW